MRIQSIEAIPVSYPEPNDFNALRHLCLCKITADDGQVGLGRVDHAVPGGQLRDQGDRSRAWRRT